MSYLIAIEGADGAGKATAAGNVCRVLQEQGLKATVISFPRYQATVGGFALGEFLSGRMRLPVAPQTAAVLYALDRFESRSVIDQAQSLNDFVLFDRYIASNMAYQGAKVPPERSMPLMRWIVDLEVSTFGLPPPHLNVYLDTPLETAIKLIAKKHQRSYTTLAFDKHENDLDLQAAVRQNYLELVQSDLLGPWAIVRTTDAAQLRQPLEIAADVLSNIADKLNTPARPYLASDLVR